MRVTACAALIMLGIWVPSAHPLLESLGGGYVLGSVAMLAIAAALVGLWPSVVEQAAPRLGSRWFALLIAGTGLGLLVWVSSRLLPAIFIGPPDPTRGDMLVIIDHAITAFLAGGNPYAIHKVPWDAPLSYGPVLWLPFVIPHALRVDLRVLTLAAQLAVPACLLLHSGIRGSQGQWPRAIAFLTLGVALAVNPEVLGFHVIGHTQIYWPLLLVFSLCLSARRWSAAAVCLGLLVAARSTMVALAPVFFLYLFFARGPSIRCLLLFLLAAALPFAPFVIADPASVSYAMLGVYLKVMKGFVWYSTTWVQNTYGVTGRLLERGLERHVEVVQLLSLALVYVLAWRRLRLGGRPEPWLGLSLLVFSMTTLWPVGYLYLDVWMVFACGLLAGDGFAPPRTLQAVGHVAGVALLCAILVISAAAVRPGTRYVVDIGSPAASGFTGGGFGRDVAVQDEGREAVWVEGETARIRLPRAGWRGATIRIALRPQLSDGGAVQRVSASINGRQLGAVTLAPGWQEITFSSRARDWNYGFNVLDLQFTYAVASVGDDQRALSAAIDRISVE